MKKQTKILKALSNEKRLEILKILENKKDLSVTEISDEIGVHFKSASKHLQKLAEAGLIIQERDGVFIRHGIKRGVDKLLSIIKQLESL